MHRYIRIIDFWRICLYNRTPICCRAAASLLPLLDGPRGAPRAFLGAFAVFFGVRERPGRASEGSSAPPRSSFLYSEFREPKKQKLNILFLQKKEIFDQKNIVMRTESVLSNFYEFCWKVCRSEGSWDPPKSHRSNMLFTETFKIHFLWKYKNKRDI